MEIFSREVSSTTRGVKRKNEKSRRRKEKEAKERIRKAEDEKERLRKLEAEKKHRELLASPQDKAQKELQKKTLIITSIGSLILIPTILNDGYFSKSNNESQKDSKINPELLDNNNNNNE